MTIAGTSGRQASQRDLVGDDDLMELHAAIAGRLGKPNKTARWRMRMERLGSSIVVP